MNAETPFDMTAISVPAVIVYAWMGESHPDWDARTTSYCCEATGADSC
ncbi:hypothetical protein [Halorhabdus amylolytica]|nr:hypothetical protein [Halorhabdus amylolytica]